MKRIYFALLIVSILFLTGGFTIPAESLCEECYQEQKHTAPAGWGYNKLIQGYCEIPGEARPCGKNNYCQCVPGSWINPCYAKFCQNNDTCNGIIPD